MSYKILVVDDSLVVRSLIIKALQQYDWEIIGAENGFEGISRARVYKPDLIILDIIMPVMNGFEMMEKLKSDPELSHIPIIMLTAESRKENVLKILKMGAHDYIVKPFNPENFINKINAVRQNVKDSEQNASTEAVNQKTDVKINNNPDYTFERLNNKEIQPFTIDQMNGSVLVTIYPHINESYLDMFELMLETIVFMQTKKIIFDVSPTSELTDNVTAGIAQKIKWINDGSCSVIIKASGDEGENKVLKALNLFVFGKAASLKEQSGKIKQSGDPFIISNDNNILIVQFGETINNKNNLIRFSKEVEEAISLKPQRAIFDFTSLQILSDSAADEITATINQARDTQIKTEVVCDNINLISQIQTLVPGIRFYRKHNDIKW